MQKVIPCITLLACCAISTAWPATYYTAPNGSNSNSGSITAPFLTIAKGASVLQPGDTLLVRAGTYSETFYDTIPGGTSWSSPVTIAAYPGETVTITPPPGSQRVFTFASSASRYIVIDGFHMDATHVMYDAVKMDYGSNGAANHIRIQNCEIKNSPNQGVLTTQPANNTPVAGYNEYINLDVHDNGAASDFNHGFYISSSNNLISHCRMHDNAGWGIQIYSGDGAISNNTVTDCQSYNNGKAGHRGVGIGVYSGSGHVVYNNIVYGNSGGIAIDYGAVNAEIFNNTVYSNNGVAEQYGIQVGSGSSNAYIANNIVWKNDGGAIEDFGAGSQFSTNLTTDPSFVNPAAADFHLLANSAAIDAGTTLAKVTTDFDGTPRPQGKAYDIGAYEFIFAQNSSPSIISAATAVPSPASVGESISFSVAASDPDGDTLEYSWNFGDGSTGQGSTTAHAYDSAGSYTAIVTVTDGRGGTVSSSVTVMVNAATAVARRINSGGSAAGSFSSDIGFVGGRTYRTTATINVNGAPNPAPQAVYQTERYGNFTYTISGLSAGGTYTVRLHFAEIYWSTAGKRLFNVAINGQQVLANFDIYTAAAGSFKAIVREFSARADTGGNITIVYSTIRDNAKSSGIEILSPTSLSSAAVLPNVVDPSTALTSINLGTITLNKAFRLLLDLPESGSAASNLHWSAVDSRRLPRGVRISRNLIGGRPKVPGTFTFDLQLKAADGNVIKNTYSISVQP